MDYTARTVGLSEAIELLPDRFQIGVGGDVGETGVSPNTNGNWVSHSWQDDPVEAGERFLILFQGEKPTHLFRHA